MERGYYEEEELTRMITRWCVTTDAYHIDEEGFRESDFSDVEYFSTKEKAMARAKEINEDMKQQLEDEDTIGSYDVETTEEDGHWITEKEYQEDYADDIEGTLIAE